MNLDTYLSTTESAASLARKLGISPVLISQWRNGVRPIPAERCPEIERITEGLITCEELRPDVSWSVLRGEPPPGKPRPLAEREGDEGQSQQQIGTDRRAA